MSDSPGQDKVPVVGAMVLWTRRIIDNEVFNKGRHGDELTDEQLSAISGKDCSIAIGPNAGRCYVDSAIRYAERTYGLCWQRVRGEGKIKCLNWSEQRDRATAKRRSFSRQSRRTIRQLDTFALNGLSDVERSEHLRIVAQMGTLMAFSSDKAARRLEQQKIEQPLDLSRLLENMNKT